MRRLDPRSLILLGFLFILSSLAFTLDVTPGHAQGEQPPEADYIGAEECSSCHQGLAREHSTTAHSRALVNVSRNSEAIKADFAAGEKERTVTFPKETTPRPFVQKDIAFMIGAGRYVERYVYQIERGKFAVFPAEWNVEKKQWQPYGATGTWPTDAAFDFVANCAGCHVTDLNVRRGRWGDDGVQCEACHGPGSVHAELGSDARNDPTEDNLKAARQAIVLSPDAQVCGQCHSQGVHEESKRPFPNAFRPGTELAKPEVFTLIKNDDPAHWWVTGHGKSNNMQYNEWLQSRHSKALDTLKSSDKAADACLECHSADYRLASLLIEKQKAGNRLGEAPTMPKLADAKNGVSCISCHQPHSPAKAESLMAMEDGYALCTSCHRNTDVTASLHHPVKEMFEGVALIKDIPGVPSVHFSEEKGPRCETCHVPSVPMGGINLASHALKPVLPGATQGQLPDTCSACHTKLTASDLQSLIDSIQATVRGRITLAQTRLSVIPKPAEGSPTYEKYQQVEKALAFILNDGSQGIHNYAYADALLTMSERTLSQLSVPGATIQPTEAPAPTATPSALAKPAAKAQETSHTGLRPMTILSMGTVLLILLIGAFVFLRRPRRQGA